MAHACSAAGSDFTTQSTCEANLGASWTAATWSAGAWTSATWTAATWAQATWTANTATWSATSSNSWNTFTYTFVDRIDTTSTMACAAGNCAVGANCCGAFPVRPRQGSCSDTSAASKDACLAIAGATWTVAAHTASTPTHPATQTDPSSAPTIAATTYNSVLVTVKDAYLNPEYCVVDVEVWDNVPPAITCPTVSARHDSLCPCQPG